MSYTPHDFGRELAPGDEPLDDTGVAHGLRGYLVGLVLAIGLTVASFYVAHSGLVWAPAVATALIVLAIAQMGVHLVFFLHVTTGPDNTNNVLALAYGVLIVFLVLAGSLWIMAHLNHTMPPMGAMMQMQR
ncbi:MAG TPA: cytochrome o ubiquinol oxidase subunit IV [Caulobacteraceae bacterium]|nr:cytochrome o ubiquinol oxidase subunit IV [Caulobacteraceae bacterium]